MIRHQSLRSATEPGKLYHEVTFERATFKELLMLDRVAENVVVGELDIPDDAVIEVHFAGGAEVLISWYEDVEEEA
jgi:hypothetical protein